MVSIVELFDAVTVVSPLTSREPPLIWALVVFVITLTARAAPMAAPPAVPALPARACMVEVSLAVTLTEPAA